MQLISRIIYNEIVKPLVVYAWNNLGADATLFILYILAILSCAYLLSVYAERSRGYLTIH
jgi:hypothetical protein